MRPLERAEFDKVLNKRAGMAAGLDGCTWEVLQQLPTAAKDKLFLVLRSMFQPDRNDPVSKKWKDFPKWFGNAWTSAIPKTGHDGTTARCRGITVTPALGRLLGKIVTARLTDYVEKIGCLCDAQDGFRKGRSTLNCVSRLETLLASGKLTHLLSIDARRAFDLVEPRLATSYLTRIGVPAMVPFHG